MKIEKQEHLIHKGEWDTLNWKVRELREVPLLKVKCKNSSSVD